jgi:hypothetical protein
MKKLYGLIALVFAVLFVAYLFQLWENDKLNDKLQLKNVELSQMKDSVLTYVTKNGQLISKIKSVEVDKRNLKDALEVIGIEKEYLKDQNIKLKNLVSVLQLEIKTFGEGQTNVVDTFYIDKVTTDTIYYQKVNDWTDNYLSLFNAKIEDKEFKFEYNYFLDMDLLVDKPKDAIIVTAKINNPNLESLKATSIMVSTKRKWWEKPWVWGIVGVGTGVLISK